MKQVSSAGGQNLLVAVLATILVVATVGLYLHLNQALIQFRLGEYALGRGEFSEAERRFANSVELGLQQSSLLKKATPLLLAGGNDALAFQAAHRLLDQRPEPWLLLQLTADFDRYKYPELALELHETYVANIDSGLVGALNHAELLRRLSRYDEATDIYRRLVSDHPQEPAPRLALAETLAWQGHYQEATTIIEQLLSSERENRPARLLLARVLSWDGRFEDAILHYRTYLGEAP